MKSVKVLHKKSVRKAHDQLCNTALQLINGNNFLYANPDQKSKNIKIDSTTFNLINFEVENDLQRNLKYLLISEAYEIEAFYPKLGDVFIEIYTEYVKNKNKYRSVDEYIEEILSNIKTVKKAEKSDIFKKIKEFECKISKNIIEETIRLAAAGTSIFLEDSLQTKTYIRKTDDLKFNLEFDNRFLLKSRWKSKKYNVILIDGFIQEVSEIHHLLTKASEDKQDYVIFCKGASEEVKKTILVNLARGTLNVFPICLKVNEENVNILNDISACLDSDVASATKGDTISACVRRELDVRENIQISENSIVLEKHKNNFIDQQKRYLSSKISSVQQNDPNYEYLAKRIKNLESDKIEIRIGDSTKNSEIRRNVDYFLKFLKNTSSGIVYLKKPMSSKKIFIHTLSELMLILRKLKSIDNVIKNIECALILE